jgi:hypothetical protein
MRVCTYSLIICLMAAGCATQDPQADSAGHGVATFQIDVGPRFAGTITRVTVLAGGQTQDLSFNSNNNTFSGSMFVPSGSQVVIARAFQLTELIGESAPVTVEILPSAVTAVMLRIPDQAANHPSYGPILDSFTFPTTAQVGVPVTFTMAVVAPVNDPVTYAWTTSCVDSIFGASSAATTSWTSATPGACTFSVVATSNGISISRSFSITAFPAGPPSGQLDVMGDFITGPTIALNINELGCTVGTGTDASCQGSATSPQVFNVGLSVLNWGQSTPGRLELSDNCGGTFSHVPADTFFFDQLWLPPVAGGVCIITGRAIGTEGSTATLSAAVVVHAGTPATSNPPAITGELLTDTDFCVFHDTTPGTPDRCGGTFVHSVAEAFALVDWRDGSPGTVIISDDCGGTPTSNGHLWEVLDTGRPTCTVTIRATSLQGSETVATGSFDVITE